MKTNLLLEAHESQGHYWLILKRKGHKTGQYILPLSLESTALMFPGVNALEVGKAYKVTVEMDKPRKPPKARMRKIILKKGAGLL